MMNNVVERDFILKKFHAVELLVSMFKVLGVVYNIQTLYPTLIRGEKS